MKLFLCTPHNRKIEPEYNISVMGMSKAAQMLGLGFEILQQESNMIPFSRNELCQLALKFGADKILFVDSDIEFSPFDVTALLDSHKDIIGGVYVLRADPMIFHVYNAATDDPESENYETFVNIRKLPEDTFQCDALGAGFLLIDYKVIKHMFSPEIKKEFGAPFNLWQRKNGNQLSEDLSFCLRAKRLGYEIWADPNLNLGHFGVKKYTKLDYFISQGYYYCNDIPGWMSVEELNWLHNTAKKMGSIIELGSWKGRSTHALASGCPGIVTAIDHFKGSVGETEGPHKEAEYGGIKETFFKNIMSKFLNVEWLEEKHKISKILYPNKQVDMIFIDGGHTYEEVKSDIEFFKPYAKKILCGHDFKWPSVNKAVEDTIGLHNVETCGSIWIKRMGE